MTSTVEIGKRTVPREWSRGFFLHSFVDGGIFSANLLKLIVFFGLFIMQA